MKQGIVSTCNATLINHDNIKIDGTFEDWIKSIAKEVDRLFSSKSKEPDAGWFGLKHRVEITPCDWDPEQNDGMPAFAISIHLGEYYLGTHFSFAKIEWDRNYKSLKAMRSILNVRFIDCIWSLYHVVREQVIFLKKMDIDCCKSLNEYGAI